MPVPFSFQAQRRSTSPEFSESASFLKRAPSARGTAVMETLRWASDEAERPPSLPSEELFRSGVNSEADSLKNGSSEPAAISPRPRLANLPNANGPSTMVPKTGNEWENPFAPQSESASLQAPVEFSGHSTPASLTVPKPPVASPFSSVRSFDERPEVTTESPISPPTAKAAASRPPAHNSREQILPRTAEDGWRAAELAVARREIARLKAKHQELEEQITTMQREWDELRNDPPAPDHRKVTMMLEQWMSTHLDSVVEQSVRHLTGHSDKCEVAESASEPWFRQQPLVSVSHPESNSGQTLLSSADPAMTSHSSPTTRVSS